MTIGGNLTADPELRYSKASKAVVNFTIAHTPSVLNRDTKKWEDGETLFMRCSAWDEFAEHIAHSLKKGDRVMAYGVLKSRTYTDREQNSRTVMELLVEDLGPSLKYANASPVKGNHQKGASAAPKPDQDGWVTVDDETPF
jgi:single-strand DNA-binding protein